MPSYLVSARESFVPMELYQAPIEALGETMRIKQQQYDQAFSQISSTMNAMENLKITDETQQVTALKQKYLADASKKLKNISSVDLSIPQNTSEANKIFEPFYNDPVLMANAGRTAYNDKQLAEYESRQMSKDDAVRGTVHPAQKEYLLNDRDKIAKAGLDVNAYRNFDFRKFIPFIDQQKYLQDAAKADGLKIVHTTGEDGPMLVEIEGGKKAQANYAAWAKTKLYDTKFNEQYMVLGTVQTEREFKELRQNPLYAKYTDEQLKAVHADNTINELETSYNTREKQLQSRNKQIDTEIHTLTYVEQPTTAIEKAANARIEALRQEYFQNEDILSDVLREKEDFADEKKQKTKELLLSKPESYYASLARNADINNFAAGRAAGTEQVKITKNDAFWMNVSSAQKDRELGQKDRELNMREAGTYDGKSGGDGGDGSSGGSGSKASASVMNGNSLGATSVGTTVEEGIDVYRNWVSQQKDVHVNSVWDPTTGLVSVVSTLGVPGDKLVAGATGWIKKSQDPKYQFNEQEAAGATAIQRALEQNLGIKISGPEGMKNALYGYTKKYTESAGTTRDYDTKDGQLMQTMITAQQTAQKLTAMEKERQRIITENISADKRYEKLVVTENGKKRMVEPKDVGSSVSDNMVYLDTKNNTWKRLTTDMEEVIGENYLKGNGLGVEMNIVTYGTQGGVAGKKYDTSNPFLTINGKKVPVRYVGGDQRIENVGKDLVSRYGKSTDVKKLYEEANNSVVANSEYFNSMRAKMSPITQFPFDTRATVTNEPGVRIIQELTLPETSATYYAYNRANNSKDKVSEEGMAALMNSMKSGEETLQKMFGPPTMNPYGSKNGSVSFTLNSSLTDKEIEAAGLKEWKGKDIVFDLNKVNSVGPTLKSLRVNQQFYVWGDLHEGKSISSPDIMRSGYKFGFTIQPDRSDNSATQAYTEFHFPVWDAKAGAWTPTSIKTASYPIKGEGAVDPDTRLNMTYAELYKQIALVTKARTKKAGINGAELLKR